LHGLFYAARGSVLAFSQEMLRIGVTALVVALLVSVETVLAQDQPRTSAEHHHPSAPDSTSAWTWTGDANVFYGYNYQQRKNGFTNFTAWESQNWFMGTGARRVGGGRLTLEGMLSLEPWTIGNMVYASGTRLASSPGGSPQLYQTGESYNGIPLVNYQHPHDLFMELGATYRVERPRLEYMFTADLVGSPALGPPPFMHRDSARNNPQVPLNHHYLDSTHISTGVLTAAVAVGQFTFEASTFRGAEPDDNRLNIERPRLDSWSSRIGWRRGAWQAQVSGGSLHEPEWFEPYDVTRLTASIAFGGDIRSRRLDATLAWGRNIEYNGYNDRADGYTLEWDLHATRMTSLYGRAELVKKQLFGLGFHPKGLNHPHLYSKIDALTIGYLRDVVMSRAGRFGVGADVTMYRTSEDLEPYYGSSRSYHIFARWRPNGSSITHVH
jgi:hypothetical protein